MKPTQTHTPGPWRLEIVEIPGMRGQWRIMGNGTHDNSLPHGGNWVGTVARSNGSRGLANARLIAAAPELLAELRILSDWVDANVGDPAANVLIGSARAAIARAKGGV